MRDANNKFVFFSIKAPASCHDSLAFFFSDLAQRLKKEGLPLNLFIIADNAYVCSDYMVVPHKNTVPGSIEDRVNFYISQLRIFIESTFGIFMRRWGLFWRPLECHFMHRAPLLTVAAKLHNFIIDHQSSGVYLPKVDEYQKVQQSNGQWAREKLVKPSLGDMLTGDHAENREARVESSRRRDAVARALQGVGIDAIAENVSHRDRITAVVYDNDLHRPAANVQRRS